LGLFLIRKFGEFSYPMLAKPTNTCEMEKSTKITELKNVVKEFNVEIFKAHIFGILAWFEIGF